MGSISLLRRGLWLEYATLGWNVIGTVIVLIAAVRAGSAALAGFGLDSAIEIFASVVVVWQLKGLERGRESLALKRIGTAFIALAIYVLVQSAWTLLANAYPAPSPLGLGMKRFRSASITIAGIELMHRIRKGQFTLGRLRIKDNRAPAVWNAVLAA